MVYFWNTHKAMIQPQGARIMNEIFKFYWHKNPLTEVKSIVKSMLLVTLHFVTQHYLVHVVTQ